MSVIAKFVTLAVLTACLVAQSIDRCVKCPWEAIEYLKLLMAMIRR